MGAGQFHVPNISFHIFELSLRCCQEADHCEVSRSEVNRDNTVNDTDGAMKKFGTHDMSRLTSTHMQKHETSDGPASGTVSEKVISSFRFD